MSGEGAEGGQADSILRVEPDMWLNPMTLRWLPELTSRVRCLTK